MTAEPKVSPRPWRVDPDYKADIQTLDGKEIGTVFNQEAVGMALTIRGTMAAKNDEYGKAHAAHIVRCVNAHDGLVEALEDAIAGMHYIEQGHGRLYGVGWDRVYDKARAALAAAKEGA